MKFWSGQRILERWNVPPTELASFIYQGLPAYKMGKGEFYQIKPEEVTQFDMDYMTDLLFKRTDIEDFEKANELPTKDESDENNRELSAKDARDLGRLRNEQEKWHSSIAVAVEVGLFCANIGRPVVRKEVSDFVNDIDSAIPFTTIDKMWKALPDKYKKGAGRPRNE
jgi:hypothetical protein